MEPVCEPLTIYHTPFHSSEL
ncbi:MAG: hypothetical protein LZF60_340118 [Nitrospira sp.]|nr:MAG: hypothetical protein LZF60_340118 [Nitrospira sp.]